MSNYSTISIDCQVLNDVSSSGRVRPWALYKTTSNFLADLYHFVNPRKEERILNCSTFLKFCRNEKGGLTLTDANFCRVRLCPTCMWRRSLKTYSHVRSIVDSLGSSCSYILLTLTIPNCPDTGSDLKKSIDDLVIGFNRLMKYKKISLAVKGYYRALEVTHNLEKRTFHPHIHTLLAVNPSYFTSRYYISQSEFLRLWNKALGRNDITQLDVRKIRGSADSACAEIAKYTVKASDIIYFDDWDLSADVLRALDFALDHRRFIGYGGIFADMHRKLHLDDEEDGDLVGAVGADDVQDEALVYAWHTGYCQYIRRS